jgi:hypothetical protein
MRINAYSAVVLILLSFHFCACSSNEVHRKLHKPEDYLRLDAGSEFLKIHYRNGNLSVFSNWQVFDSAKLIIGKGVLYNPNREIIKSGVDTISYSAIALLETNISVPGDNLVGMSLFTGSTIALAVYCASNPKACFGSCPTFYAWDGKHKTLMAEGFSSSILPSLEAEDIDALYGAVPRSQDFQLEMTNEALETHLIRHADLLIAKRPPGGRMMQMTDNTFREGLALIPPSKCMAAEGSILQKVESFDESERSSYCDSNDLLSKETIEVQFDKNPGVEKGLVLGFRQSLLTTFLFYQGLAYLGDSAGAFFAHIENDPEFRKMTGDPFKGLLGGIEVDVQDQNGKWRQAGEFYEAGPIAHNIQTLSLPDSLGDGSRIRLRMTKGMWRINYIAQTILGKRVEPERLLPDSVTTDTGLCPQALTALLSNTRHLVSMPGDKWVLHYTLPKDFWNYDLFLSARGYYLEWMRKEWLAETNPSMAAMMFALPFYYLKQEAPVFKKVEKEMENTFWNSRYVRH